MSLRVPGWRLSLQHLGQHDMLPDVADIPEVLVGHDPHASWLSKWLFAADAEQPRRSSAFRWSRAQAGRSARRGRHTRRARRRGTWRITCRRRKLMARQWHATEQACHRPDTVFHDRNRKRCSLPEHSLGWIMLSRISRAARAPRPLAMHALPVSAAG